MNFRSSGTFGTLAAHSAENDVIPAQSTSPKISGEEAYVLPNRAPTIRWQRRHSGLQRDVIRALFRSHQRGAEHVVVVERVQWPRLIIFRWEWKMVRFEELLHDFIGEEAAKRGERQSPLCIGNEAGFPEELNFLGENTLELHPGHALKVALADRPVFQRQYHRPPHQFLFATYQTAVDRQLTGLDLGVVLLEVRRVEHETVDQAAERRQAKADLIDEPTTLIMSVVRIMLRVPCKHPAQDLLFVTMLAENLDGQLFHYNRVFVSRNRLTLLFQNLLDRSLVVAIGFHLEPVKLYLLDVELALLLNDFRPI